MKQTEWNKRLAQLELTDADACSLMFMQTGVVIDPRHIKLAFSRKEHISRPMAAAFTLLFKEVEKVRLNGKKV